MSRRAQLAAWVDRAGLADLVLRTRAQLPQHALTVVTYHRVQPSHAPAPFDEQVIDATPESFDSQLGTIAQHFRTVGIDDLIGFLDGKPLPPNPILITFDDGYRDNRTHALPLLQKHGLRAVFFVVSKAIEERRVFWWDRIAYLIKQSTRTALDLTYPSRFHIPLEPRRPAIDAVLRLVKDGWNLDLARFLDELAVAAGVSYTRQDDQRHANSLLMTWDEVRQLADAGMDVESHTRTHRLLGTIPPDQLSDELRGSRQELEAVLDRPVRALAYPAGGGDATTRPVLRDALRAAGYQLAFTSATGINQLVVAPTLDRFGIRRVCIDHDLPPSYFRAFLAMPFLRP